MAHFAQIDSNNKVVQVVVINNNILINNNGLEDENLGIEFCKSLYGQDTNWLKTSYNTKGNVYYKYVMGDDGLMAKVLDEDQSKVFRGNFAGINSTYDPVNDVFIDEKPVDDGLTYELNTTKWTWEVVE